MCKLHKKQGCFDCKIHLINENSKWVQFFFRFLPWRLKNLCYNVSIIEFLQRYCAVMQYARVSHIMQSWVIPFVWCVFLFPKIIEDFLAYADKPDSLCKRVYVINGKPMTKILKSCMRRNRAITKGVINWKSLFWNWEHCTFRRCVDYKKIFYNN